MRETPPTAPAPGKRRRRRPRVVAEGDVDTAGIESLAAALGRNPTTEEEALWVPMSPTNRREALARIALMRRWSGDRQGLDAAAAADLAGVGVKRFYQMASAWAKAPGLGSVGSFAGAKIGRASKIDPRANAALQAHLAAVVRWAGADTIEAQRKTLETLARQRLAREYGTEASAIKLPSRNVVREMIAAERRRRRESAPPASRVALDFAATSLARADGTPHLLFVVLDRGSGLILGCHVGRGSEPLAGYSGAMSSLIEGGCWTGLSVPWANRTNAIDVVLPNAGAGEAAAAPFAIGPGLPTIQPATAEPPGRYLRDAVGERIARLHLHFARTARHEIDARTTIPDRFTEFDARIRALDDARRHNEAVADWMGWPGEAGGGSPPANLLAAAAAFADVTRELELRLERSSSM